MPKVAVYNIAGDKTGEIELNDSVFGVEVNEAVVHQAVVMQQANQRQGTAATKTRGMVRGGGRKPWRQKGTGRARAGSNSSPVWVGGGTTFGPHPRSYAFSMPRKARRLAIKSALSAKVQAGELLVMESIEFARTQDQERVNDAGQSQGRRRQGPHRYGRRKARMSKSRPAISRESRALPPWASMLSTFCTMTKYSSPRMRSAR